MASMSAAEQEAIQSLIDKSIEAYDLRMQASVSYHVQEKIDEQRTTIGTILGGAQASLTDLEKKVNGTHRECSELGGSSIRRVDGYQPDG